MSIRIHKLAEELGLDNKEMMALLKERKIIAQDVKSVSSTVENINASALREEFAPKGGIAVATVFASDVPAPAPSAAVETPGSPPKISLPPGVFAIQTLSMLPTSALPAPTRARSLTS